MRTICASSVSAPTRSARITIDPFVLTVPPVTLLPADFSTGIGSPVIIDSSIAHAPSFNDPVPRHALSRTHADAHARRDVVDVDVTLTAVIIDYARALGRESEQRFDRMRRPLARAQFEDLPEEDERGDDGGGLVVEREVVADERRDNAEAEGRAPAHPDQR